MPDESRISLPQMEKITVTSALPYAVFDTDKYDYKAGPCIISIVRTAGAATPNCLIVDADDGANLRATQMPWSGGGYAITNDQAIPLLFTPKSIGIYSGTAGPWTVDVYLHF